MDTAESYVYRVYLEKSFSRAAEKLYISQPSLSAAVARKERELGFRIFDRSTKPVSLTARGAIYLEMLEEIAECERNMQRRVQKLSNDQHQFIGIGGGSFSTYYLMTCICGAFYRRYPGVEVILDFGSFGAASAISERISLFDKLDKGDLDAVFSYEYDTERYDGIPVYSERLVVAMHKSLVTPTLLPYAVSHEALLNESYDPACVLNGRGLFRDIPFLDFSRTSHTYRYMSDLLGDYVASPHKITNSRHSVVHFNMMRAGAGALLVSDYVVAMSSVGQSDIVYFVFPKEASTRSIYLITKKEAVFHSNMRNFISLAKEIGSSRQTTPFYD
ncbi:MAG: LysR family transcriptional regulator [Clostridia bacterium]|nr:LysR family transcriptional regulator [Clostridia bacterium]